VKQELIRAILPRLYRIRGQHRALQSHLDNMPVEALRDLHDILRTLDDELHDARRTTRLFPGGPKFKF
jgi:hypothetical protein